MAAQTTPVASFRRWHLPGRRPPHAWSGTGALQPAGVVSARRRPRGFSVHREVFTTGCRGPRLAGWAGHRERPGFWPAAARPGGHRLRQPGAVAGGWRRGGHRRATWAMVMRRAGPRCDRGRRRLPAAPNVVGVLEGRTPGRTLMLCGHLDTVGVEGMRDSVHPGRARGTSPRAAGAQGHEERGRRHDRRRGPARRPRRAAFRAAGGGGPSPTRNTRAWGPTPSCADHAADGAVVTEPTDLRMATCHKGFEWVEVETRGRAAHGSRPGDGRDAILRMGRVLARPRGGRRAARRGAFRTPCWGPAVRSMPRPSPGGRELSVYPDRLPPCRSSAGPCWESRRTRGLAEAAGDSRRPGGGGPPSFEGSARPNLHASPARSCPPTTRCAGRWPECWPGGARPPTPPACRFWDRCRRP